MKKNMKEHKINAILFFIDTVLFAVIAGMNIYNDKIIIAVTYIAISILFLGAGLSALKNLKRNKK